jgi:hypothetical protein
MQELPDMRMFQQQQQQQRLPTCISSSTARGSSSVCWLGLFLALPILASSLLGPTPAEAVKDSRDSSSPRSRAAMTAPGGSSG